MKKDFIDHLTGIPSLITLTALGCIIVYCFFIQPQNYYVKNSKVLAKGSYIEIKNNNKLNYLLLPNFYGEIKKKSHYQKEIPMLELQKAAYRKEIKVLNNLKENPKSTQAIFDTAMWYIISSGIKSNVNQAKTNRLSRLIAALFYLNLLEKTDNKNTETSLFIDEIENFINNTINKNPEAMNFITEKATKNLEIEPTEIEQKQSELFNSYVSEPNNTTNIENLCSFYDKQIEKTKKVRKLGYLLAAKTCYTKLNTISDNKNGYNKKIKTLSKDINSFNYSLK
ncbi:MAG: hypothetical protein AB7V50_08815 [Vampirovibrionia bacterium]